MDQVIGLICIGLGVLILCVWLWFGWLKAKQGGFDVHAVMEDGDADEKEKDPGDFTELL